MSEKEKMLRVSFYSYKGGSGRSTTSWNTIHRLVEKMRPTVKKPFVIIDTDVKSAGSTFLYKADDIFYKDERSWWSVLKWMATKRTVDYEEADESQKEKFFKRMYPIGKRFFGLPENEDGAVLLIGANLHKTSIDSVDVEFKDGDDSDEAKNFRAIADSCEECGATAFFFDTPSGTQPLANRSVWESDIVVCCMRPTSQFRDGTRRQLIDYINTDIKRRIKRKYILTPTAVCMDENQIFGTGEDDVYPQKAKKDIKTEFDPESMEGEIKQAFKDNVILDMLKPTPDGIKQKCYSEKDSGDNESVFGIPEVKRFKWFEKCLGILPEGELLPNDMMAINRYEYLAHVILKNSDWEKREK